MSVFWVYIYSLAHVIGLEWSLFQPDLFWILGAIILLFNFLFVWLATHRRLDINFFNFLISPFLFMLSGLVFLLFSGNSLIKQAVILFMVVSATIFMRYLVIYNYHRHNYPKHGLSSISRIINLTTIFFFYTGWFNLHGFLRVSLWFLALASTVVIVLVFYQFFNINKIKGRDNKYFIWVAALIFLELFYVLHWLPFLSYSKALLVVSAYYFIISLTKHYFAGSLEPQVYRRYSLVTGIIWILTLATSRWG